ncbi:MAG TPA: thiamine pyrophosphate-binding protein [Thermoanaerobaculia bacterium]|nr:thiamine pyrophosphate-binding protein [Thermoanaerobaculia bacterium]HQR67585.1 thiamine pyrophosphate-binding protein [Thermoanaerobaculia bacterium]
MTAPRTGAELVVKALEDEGIALAFGIPGTHNIELYDALHDSTVRAVLVTDEQSASFMADAAFRASGRMACVNVVPGAGLTHALSGIAEAYLDGIPMLILGCGIRRDTGKAFQLHDVDQLAIARPVTKAQLLPASGAELHEVVRRACRIARSGVPGPVFVEVPADQYLFRHEAELAPPAPEPAPPSPPEEAVAQAAKLLSSARRPLLYLGLGAAGAGADLVALAEKLESPVSTTFQGKGVFPESHPLWLWPGFGDAAPPFARAVAATCDATLAIGCRFGEVATGSYGISPKRPLIHVDVDPSVPGRNFPADLSIAADAGAFVAALLPQLAPRLADGALRRHIEEGRADAMREVAVPSEERVTPHLLLRALQETFGPETVFTTDSGNGTFLAVEGLRLDRPGRLLAPVDFSCMGYAVPAALGAKLARPEAPVVALAGDGAFLMTGLELLTAVQNRLGVAVFVLRDRELAQIAQFQSTALGRKSLSTLPDHDLPALARALGVEALTLSRDAGIPSVVRRAKEVAGEGRPVLVDTAIDYSTKTFFTRGVVKTNFLRLPWSDRLRFVARAVSRKLLGAG